MTLSIKTPATNTARREAPTSPPASPHAASPTWEQRDVLAPIVALQQQVALCTQPPVNALGALRRSRQITHHWRKLLSDGVFPDSERARAQEAMADAHVRLKRMERLTHMMPASDFVLRFGERKAYLGRGSIADAEVAAVVTAANAELAGGGGVDHVVHAAAGPSLLKACRKIGGCETGHAVITDAFDLEKQDVRHVIHAVGPVWRGGNYNEEALLRNAYMTSLALADANGCASVAFPAISCGVYRFPARQAAHIALQAVANYLQTAQGPLKDVVFVLFDDAVFKAFADTLVGMAP